MGVNKSILVGNVGSDPEIKEFDSGDKVAQFSLATNETYKNKEGERVTKTEWHNIVIYKKLADVVEMYVKKGTQLYLEGKIRTRQWDDKDGNKRYITEIVCNSMQMLGSKSEEKEQPTPPGNNNVPEPGDEPDLPF